MDSAFYQLPARFFPAREAENSGKQSREGRALWHFRLSYLRAREKSFFVAL
jgi:hypothetical protein